MRPGKSPHISAPALIIFAAISFPTAAHAMPVFDSAVLAAVNSVNASVGALNASTTQLLYNIGLAVNQNGQKISSTIEASAKAQREFDTVQQTNRLMENARQRYDIPESLCAESASGGADAVAAYSSTARSGMRPGGGSTITNRSIAQAINSPALPQGIDASRAAKIHAQFCDADDFAAYGGAQVCPAISTRMPGADKRFDTLQHGAGPNGKKPELTYSQEQIDVAHMYVQNTIRRSIGPQIRKTEANTAAGAQYIGLMNQYNAIISAAAEPLEQRIADSQANPVTKELLKEALKSASANAYFSLIASNRARTTGTMSAREFEAFEIGRRYANTAYQTDLQAMGGDNLIRELIRVSALNSWLLHSLKSEVQKDTILNGIALSSQARQEYEPILTQKFRSIPGTGR